jgi:hypothetical protein
MESYKAVVGGFVGQLTRKRTALERTSFNCIQKSIPLLLVLYVATLDKTASVYNPEFCGQLTPEGWPLDYSGQNHPGTQQT